MESSSDNNWEKKEAVRLYAYGAAYTAGKLKSHQMLLEKALLLMHAVRAGDLERRNQVQNIVAYLQASLDLEYEQAHNLFIVYGHLWDALEAATQETLDLAEELLREVRELIMEVHRRQPRPIKKKRK
ncbi:MAG: flagellar protein FliS [Fibromonadaceae bacterium]|jgi:flagellin-specific chaperone FliS|nr:flagellar protein FliS [Fibromonadaceae bacterium]